MREPRPTRIAGQSWANYIAATLFLRDVPGPCLACWRSAGLGPVPDTETSIKLLVGRPAFLAGATGKALAERAQAIYREIDRELVLVPMTGGGTDAGYAVRSGKATVVESFGLAGFGYHARDEYIEIDSIVPRLYLTTRLMTVIGRQ